MFEGARLLAALFVAPEPGAVARAQAAGMLDTPFAEPQSRFGALAGRMPAGQPDAGAVVCACLNVGRYRIIEAAKTAGCTTLDAIGKATGAGATCGSCRPEIQALLREIFTAA